jgi:uncharacterized protein YaaN involved in tellurite resistance
MNTEDFIELDLLAANLLVENKELKARNDMLEAECKALREQVYNLEKQVYSGPTM